MEQAAEVGGAWNEGVSRHCQALARAEQRPMGRRRSHPIELEMHGISCLQVLQNE